MQTLVSPSNQPNVVRSTDHSVVADSFCGDLLVLPNKSVLARGFTKNIGHFHVQFEETYLVLDGELKMALHYPDTDKIVEIWLKPLDAVCIPRGVGHKVIGGTDDNRIMVSCEPAFVPGDECRSAILEDRFPSTAHFAGSLVITDGERLRRLVKLKSLLDDFSADLQAFDRFTIGSSDEIADWRHPYSTSRFAESGKDLSDKITLAQLRTLDGGNEYTDIDRMVREYFTTFYAHLREGLLVSPTNQSDGLYDIGADDGRSVTKAVVAKGLERKIRQTWCTRIRELTGVE